MSKRVFHPDDDQIIIPWSKIIQALHIGPRTDPWEKIEKARDMIQRKDEEISNLPDDDEEKAVGIRRLSQCKEVLDQHIDVMTNHGGYKFADKNKTARTDDAQISNKRSANKNELLKGLPRPATSFAKILNGAEGPDLIPKSVFYRQLMEDHEPLLSKDETTYGGHIGQASDTLTRIKMGADPVEALKYPEKGAILVNNMYEGDDYLNFYRHKVSTLVRYFSEYGPTLLGDMEMGRLFVQIVTHETVFRAGVVMGMPEVMPFNKCVSDLDVEHVERAARRSCDTLVRLGERAVSLGFDLAGCTSSDTATVLSPSDGDLLTSKSLVDFKNVSKNPVGPVNRYQLLIYYLMGIDERRPEFENIEFLRVFSTRMGEIYTCSLSDISRESVEKFSYYGNFDIPSVVMEKFCASDELRKEN